MREGAQAATKRMNTAKSFTKACLATWWREEFSPCASARGATQRARAIERAATKGDANLAGSRVMLLKMSLPNKGHARIKLTIQPEAPAVPNPKTSPTRIRERSIL